MHEDLLAVAVRAARAGGAVLRESFGASDLGATEKAKNDFVSRADRESEQAVTETILGTLPGHALLGEEGGLVGDPASRHRWIVDPLDGTTNFLRGVPFFCVSVACREGDEVVVGAVLDPLRDDLFTARRGAGALRNGEPLRVSEQPGLESATLATGFPFKAHPAIDLYLEIFRSVFLEARAVRRCGAAALDLAYTAAGVFDGFFEFRLSPWDLAAGTLLIEEAGGRATDLDGGSEFLEKGSVIAGSPGVQADLQSLVDGLGGETALERLVPR